MFSTSLSFPFNFFFVGGCVRDLLMGKKPKDIDIVAPIRPEVLLSVGCKPVNPASSIPVFLFNHPGLGKIEIALPRQEKKTGVGYKGFAFEFDPTIPLEEDLQRRDFTINAMAMDVHGRIIDPFGGREDLKNKVLRAVSPSAFVEDPLRVIRACRFSAKGFNVHAETLALMQKVSTEEFKALPVERFTLEMLKAMEEPHPEKFLQTLVQVPNACRVFFPELMRAMSVLAGPVEYHPEGSLFNHIVSVMLKCSTVESRIAALMHDMGKLLSPEAEWPHHYDHDKNGEPLVDDICKRLKLPSALTKIATFCTKEHMRVSRKDISPAKLINIAEKAIKARAVDALKELLTANSGLEQAERFDKAVNIASIPAKNLNLDLSGRKPEAIRNMILQKRILIFSNNF